MFKIARAVTEIFELVTDVVVSVVTDEPPRTFKFPDVIPPAVSDPIVPELVTLIELSTADPVMLMEPAVTAPNTDAPVTTIFVLV